MRFHVQLFIRNKFWTLKYLKLKFDKDPYLKGVWQAGFPRETPNHQYFSLRDEKVIRDGSGWGLSALVLSQKINVTPMHSVYEPKWVLVPLSGWKGWARWSRLHSWATQEKGLKKGSFRSVGSLSATFQERRHHPSAIARDINTTRPRCRDCALPDQGSGQTSI